MKIAFDHQTFTHQAYGGISRYYTILANELLKQQQDVKIFAGLHRNNYVNELPNSVVKGKWINSYPPKTGRIFQWLNHALSQAQIKSWQPDVIHETYYSALPTLKTDAVRITTVHDMIHELFSEQFSPRDKTTQWKKKTFERVDHIISISHNKKRDLIELFGIDQSKVSVVHHGVELHKASLTEGVDSQMLVQSKSSDDFTVLGPQTKFQKAMSKLRPTLDSIPVRRYPDRTKTLFSPSWVPFAGLVDKINALNPDVVHLHWIAGGMMRIEDLAKINAPIEVLSEVMQKEMALCNNGPTSIH